jgi:hypothetical protein
MEGARSQYEMGHLASILTRQEVGDGNTVGGVQADGPWRTRHFAKAEGCCPRRPLGDGVSNPGVQQK